PLRERAEDLDPMVDRFLEEASRASGGVGRRIDDGAAALLRAHDWPGNVRELRNVIERAVVICAGATVMPEDLPESLRVPRAPTDDVPTEMPPAGEEGDA